MTIMIRRILFYFILFAATFLSCSFRITAQSDGIITVKANELKATIQPTMWGIFFEDINFGADGGLYGELVKNRSFEFFNPFMGWNAMKQPRDSAKILFVNVGSKSLITAAMHK